MANILNPNVDALDVFKIKIHPSFEVLQFPSIPIKHNELSNKLSEHNINYFYSIRISKEDIEETFSQHHFKNLMILRIPVREPSLFENYLFIDAHMTELFSAAYEVYRVSKLKVFW